MRDFTLHTYRLLLQALKQAGFVFYTFEDKCIGRAEGRYVILRHDVDLKAPNSLATARIEAELGICSSYYFRVVPQSNQPEIIKAIASLGHEVGYHYEDMALVGGDTEKAIIHFEKQLEYFRQFYPVRTICMHGSPTSKWDNRDLWKNYDYREFGIIGEPYLDFLNKAENGILYLTDTGRMWDGDKYNVRDKGAGARQVKVHSTFDLIRWLESNPQEQVLMITTHPQRWTNDPIAWWTELLLQGVKNRVKRVASRGERQVNK